MQKIKLTIEEHIPEKEEDKECGRCGAIGATDFVGEYLCDKCIKSDVFDEMNDNYN